MTRFGFNFQLEEYSIELIMKAAKLIEELGLYAVFVNDHYMKPSRGNIHYNNLPDAFLTLTAIASQTEYIKLGTAVTPIPFRSAPQTAKIVTTLDNISRGRFFFGIGAGWNQDEFEGYGSEFLPPGERVSMTIEGIRLMKRMWLEEKVTFNGKYYHIKDSVLLPKPIQKPYTPILVGSKSERMLRFTAREGDGWIPGHLQPEEYQNTMNQIITNAEKCGRNRDNFTFIHFTRILTGPHMDEVIQLLSKDEISRIRKNYLVGSPETCVEMLQEYVDIGVDLILLRLHHIAQTSFTDETKHQQQIAFIDKEIFSKL
ncbi:MAG: LLM class flavin-dependent oxidoreductase [Candidatus Bathyarchaeota archaeon]|nr:MAG: LLM class flavin-dependent oxidoreductase [Candidatus Bathyarchaeota archaeon]